MSWPESSWKFVTAASAGVSTPWYVSGELGYLYVRRDGRLPGSGRDYQLVYTASGGGLSFGIPVSVTYSERDFPSLGSRIRVGGAANSGDLEITDFMGSCFIAEISAVIGDQAITRSYIWFGMTETLLEFIAALAGPPYWIFALLNFAKGMGEITAWAQALGASAGITLFRGTIILPPPGVRLP